ncbi:hypothetical protein D3C76_360440 [compost metagenome]
MPLPSCTPPAKGLRAPLAVARLDVLMIFKSRSAATIRVFKVLAATAVHRVDCWDCGWWEVLGCRQLDSNWDRQPCFSITVTDLIAFPPFCK